MKTPGPVDLSSLMVFFPLRRFAVLVGLTIILSAAATVAQPPLTVPPPVPPPAEAGPERAITAETIQARKQQAEAVAGLDDATRQKVAGLYDQALEAINRANASTAKAEAFRQDTDNVQARLQQVQQRLDELRNAPAAPPVGPSLPELEQELAKADRRLVDLKQAQAAIEAGSSLRANRRREVRDLLFSIPQQMADIDRQLDALPPKDEPAALTMARQSELLARRVALEQEIPALKNELAKFDAEDAVDLLRLQRDASIQEVAAAERQFKLVDDRVKQLRDEAARDAVRQADDELFRTLPALTTYAEQNKELADQTQQLTQLTSETDATLQQVKTRLEEVQRQFSQAQERVDSVGLTRSVGAQLRKLKASLPNVSRRRQNIRDRQQTIEDVRFQLFELDDERTQLAKPEAVVEQILDKTPPQTSNAERERLRDAARRIVERKQEYLDGLIRIQNTYFDALTSLDTAEQMLVNLTDEYVSYIDERVLWIRSGRSLTADYTPSATNLWIVSPAQWFAVAQQLSNDMRESPVQWAIAAALFVLLLLQRRRIRHGIGELGLRAARTSCTRFRLTVQAAGLTLTLAAIWPAMCAFVAWRMTRAPAASPFVGAVAAGLWVQACTFFVAESLRQICRGNGLAEDHFDWSPAAVRTLRGNLFGLIALGLPLIFVTVVLYTSDPEQGTGLLERICFIAVCLVASVFLRRVLRPTGGLLHEYLATHRDGWVDRLQYVWYWGCVAAPLALAALTYFGYVYTAEQLTVRLFSTVSLILLVVVIRAMLLRLLLVHRRQLSIRQARERRAAALAAAEAEGETGARSLSQSMIHVEEATDLAQSSSQTQRIVTTLAAAAILVGVWCIWDDVVPALRVLDNWTVGSTVEKVTENVAEPGQEPRIETRDELRTVTVADLLLGLLVGVITWIAFRNLPGLMEMALLQRLPLEASVRYAITALASYAIILIGVLIAAATVGLRWSQIQWLAAALTFGLAFGLQEIFANFVAGLIILFEQPIRVGDVVTVDDITGVVSRVRMRATTITNWDRKEFVVPNKEFITGRLLNWTLSDKINRIVITVGVAYGSPTDKVRDILLEIAKQHPLTMDNPEPIVAFDGFGDSALNFTLRVFLSTMENRLIVTHDLHTAIHNALNEAGISIPFPQRDLHVRTIEPAVTVAPPRPAKDGGDVAD